MNAVGKLRLIMQICWLQIDYTISLVLPANLWEGWWSICHHDHVIFLPSSP